MVVAQLSQAQYVPALSTMFLAATQTFHKVWRFIQLIMVCFLLGLIVASLLLNQEIDPTLRVLIDWYLPSVIQVAVRILQFLALE